MKTIYDLNLKVLTPLHIGSGEVLEKRYDYAVYEKQTYFINFDVWVEKLKANSDERYRKIFQAIPPGDLLTDADFNDRKNFYYVAKGIPITQTQSTPLRACVKTVFHQPYIPGSTLKGGLRTLIFRHAFRDKKMKLTPTQLNSSRSWAAQRLERELFGADPNHDLLRVCQISDSSGVDPSAHLQIFNARVFSQTTADVPIAIECLRANSEFTATLTLDEFLLKHPKLNFGRSRNWLTGLPRYANEQAKQRLLQELAYFQAKSGDKNRNQKMEDIYQKLLGYQANMGDNTFLLQIGWGGGWDNKTLSFALNQTERHEMVQQYRLGRGSYSADRPFPKSRRAISQGAQEVAQPVAPLGWLLVEMVQREGGGR